MLIRVLITLILFQSAALVFFWVRLRLFKTAAKKISDRLDFVLSNDTNIGIDIETNEKSLVRLTNSLNKDILLLRGFKNEYRKKDIELRESISNISHDLRTPLTVINSYVNLIERSDTSLSEKSRNCLEIIKDRTKVMVSLIEELFNYSLYESEQVQMELSEACLNDCLEKALTEFYSIITEKGIEVDINITKKPILRTINTKAFDRVIGNIMNNAIKYTNGDLSIALNENGEMLFRNSAPNLDTVAVGKLFNRFFTVEDGESSTGLGLSIAKILTERMGGQISAELIDSNLYIRLAL